MLGFLKTSKRQSVRTQPARSVPRVEQLEGRALPSVSSAVHTLQHQVKDIQSDLGKVASNILSVVNTLGTNTSTAVTIDIHLLRAAQTQLNNAVMTSHSGVAAINALFTAEASLRTDLGSNLSNSIDKNLRNVENAQSDILADEKEIAQDAGKVFSQIQSEMNRLVSEMGTSLGSKTKADTKALQTALTGINADLNANTAIHVDLHSAGSAIISLRADWGNPTSGSIQDSISTMWYGFVALQQAEVFFI